MLLSEFAVPTCNRPQSCKLEVCGWVVKCRICDPFSEISGLFLFMPEFSMNLHVYDPSGWTSVMVSPFPCCGAMVCSMQSSPHHTWQAVSPAYYLMSASPLRSEDICGEANHNYYYTRAFLLYHHQSPRSCEWPEQSHKGINLPAIISSNRSL